MIKKKRDYKDLDKGQIITEYLTEENTYKSLGEKYVIPQETIKSWVWAYRKALPSKDKAHLKEATAPEGDLAEKLRKAELKNQLLEEMLRLSEEMTGINLRKKFGTRQS